MSEGYFTGIFKIVLACGMCRENEREEKRKREGKKGRLFQRGDEKLKLTFRENSEESPAKLFHNLWVFMARERERRELSEVGTKYIVTSEGSSFIVIIYTNIIIY